MPIISYPSPRVAQLDAHILDLELVGLLKQQLAEIFENHNLSRWTYNLNPEIWSLFLNLLVFRLTVWKSGTSYGLKLQNLKLSNFRNGNVITKGTRGLLFGLLVGDYLYSRFQLYLYQTDEIEDGERSSGRRFIIGIIKAFLVKHKEVLLTRTNDVLKIANLVNFLLFLLNGNYPLLTHRVLGISLTPIDSELLKFTGNNVNFEFQNRQLVWNVMTEFLVFILPFLRLKAIRRAISKVTSNKPQKQVIYSNIPDLHCAYCVLHNRTNCFVTNPYITNCNHKYCYICIATLFNGMKNDGDDFCLKCGEKLEWFKAWNDVDESAIIVLYEEAEAEEEDDEQNDRSDDDDDDDDEQNDSDYESNLDSSDYSEGEDYMDEGMDM